MPRIYFEGNNVDNDAAARFARPAADHLRRSRPRDDRWAVVVVSKSGGTLETAAALRVFLRARRRNTTAAISQWLTQRSSCRSPARSGRLFDLAKAIGCRREGIPIPGERRRAVFRVHGGGPAAGGGDGPGRRALLRGRRGDERAFLEEPPERNPVLQFAGVSHLHGRDARCNDARALDVVARSWRRSACGTTSCSARASASRGAAPTPLTVVQHARPALARPAAPGGPPRQTDYQPASSSTRTNRLQVGRTDFDQDQLNALANKTLPVVLEAALAGTNKAYRDDNRPTADIWVEILNEHTLGHFSR